MYLIGLMYNIANSQIPLVNCQFLPEMILPIILTKMGIEQPMAGRPKSPPPIFLSFAYFSTLLVSDVKQDCIYPGDQATHS